MLCHHWFESWQVKTPGHFADLDVALVYLSTQVIATAKAEMSF